MKLFLEVEAFGSGNLSDDKCDDLCCVFVERIIC